MTSAQLIGDVVRRVAAALPAHHFAVDVQEHLPPLSIDWVEIDQVLSNLVENAAKYSPVGTKVWIAARRDGASVGVQVADRGPGIPREALPYLFTPFYRVAPRAGKRARRGRAWGWPWRAAWSRRTAAAIAVRNRDDGGAIFTFTLPMATPPAGDVPEPIGSAGRAARERGARGRGTGPRRGRRAGDPARRARQPGAPRLPRRRRRRDGPGGARPVDDAQHPDLILLDLGLPDMDGLDVFRKVRERAGTPIIVLSARGEERDKVAGARPRRRRLPDQAVRHGRAAGAHPCRAAPRRAGTRPSGAIFRTGELRVDLERRRVAVGGREVHLTPTEYELLKALIATRTRC